MAKKIALCRVSDTEPLLSLVRMLEYAGYECVLPDRGLRDYLRSIGCGNVDEFSDMREKFGAEMPPARLHEFQKHCLAGIDLLVDVNAFRNGPLVWKDYPQLKDKTLCYFINGGPPRSTEDKGNGIDPPCPVITTNQWYRTDTYQEIKGSVKEIVELGHTAPWRDKSYVFYPSFERWDRVLPRRMDPEAAPVCFCHNVMGWGYGEFVEGARNLGVKFYGFGSSPDGMMPHEITFEFLAKTPCVVYLKGGGAVDYAVLEAMAAGVPVLFPVRYMRDTRTEELMGLCGALDDRYLLQEIETAVSLYRDPVRNAHLGAWAQQRVRDLCWNEGRDGPEFAEWMGRMFR